MRPLFSTAAKQIKVKQMGNEWETGGGDETVEFITSGFRLFSAVTQRGGSAVVPNIITGTGLDLRANDR